MTHFSSVASFFKLLTCARSQSLSACPLIRRERKGEEAEDGQRSHGRTLRLDHCTEKACFFFLFSIFHWHLKVFNVPLTVKCLIKRNNTSFTWVSKGQSGNKSVEHVAAGYSISV